MTDRDVDYIAGPRRREPNRRRKAKRGGMLVPFLLLVIIVLLAACGGLVAGMVTGYLPGRFGPHAEAAAAPEVEVPKPEITKSAVYGDWVYTCFKQPDGGDVRCGIAQQLSNAQTNTPLMLWQIVQDGAGGLTSQWRTRTGVLVGRGITVRIGAGQPIQVPFEACISIACQAALKLTPDLVDALNQASTASVTVYPIGNGKGAELRFSMKGLVAGIAALQHG